MESAQKGFILLITTQSVTEGGRLKETAVSTAPGNVWHSLIITADLGEMSETQNNDSNVEMLQQF